MFYDKPANHILKAVVSLERVLKAATDPVAALLGLAFLMYVMYTSVSPFRALTLRPLATLLKHVLRQLQRS